MADTRALGDYPVAAASEATDKFIIDRNDGVYNVTIDKILAPHLAAANPHVITKTTISLGNVTNDAQLTIASNLFDLASASVARTNLGVSSVAEVAAAIKVHTDLQDNPHVVTLTQVGIPNVTNNAQLKIASNLDDLGSKSTARTNLSVNSVAEVAAAIKVHTDLQDNPHVVTQAQVGLSNVDNFSSSDNPQENADSFATTKATKILYDLIQAAVANTVPVGAIFWIVATASVPTGYALCDGNGGRPNLINKFVRGGTAASTGGFDSNLHAHVATSEAVALTINQIPAHEHTLAGSVAYADSTSGESFHPKRGHSISFSNKTNTTGSGQTHNHSIGMTEVTLDNKPPYITLKPIIKV